MAKKKKQIHVQEEFIWAQLLNELNQKVPVAQELKEIGRPSKPEQLGLSSLIHLEVVRI